MVRSINHLFVCDSLALFAAHKPLSEAINVSTTGKTFSDLTDCPRLALQMDNQIVVSDYAQMDRVLREERAYILNMVKQIKKAGCNVLLIQKSILR